MIPAMADVVWVAWAAATTLAALLLVWIALSQFGLWRQSEELAKIATATHALVNSRMAVQLKLNATVARRLAEITKDAVDVEAADQAEKLYQEHMGRQAEADAMVKGTGA